MLERVANQYGLESQWIGVRVKEKGTYAKQTKISLTVS